MTCAKAVWERKNELRTLMKQRREALSEADREKFAAEAVGHLWSLPVMKESGALMAFASVGSEPHTMPIVNEAWAQRWQVALPRVVQNERRMEAAWVNSWDELTRGTMGIQEPLNLPRAQPAELDVIIVPGLCFDKRGYRLGYGAGYYDGFLPQATGAVRIAYTFSCCIVDEVPTEAHDEPVHWLLTEHGLIRCGGGT